MEGTKILAIAGSIRQDSFNKKLLKLGIEALKDAGADVTHIDLKDYPLPIYDGDLEVASGIPEKALQLMDIFIENKGILIASPEYNSSVPGGFKNMIDWISRPVKGLKPLAAFNYKVVGLMAASAGSLGGFRGLIAMKYLMSNIKSIVLPEMVSIPNAGKAFDENGMLEDGKMKLIHGLANKLVEISWKIGKSGKD